MNSFKMHKFQDIKKKHSPGKKKKIGKRKDYEKDQLLELEKMPLSDYEIERLKRLEERDKFLQSLNTNSCSSINAAKKELIEVLNKSRPVHQLKRKTKRQDLPPRREPSARIRNLQLKNVQLQSISENVDLEEDPIDERVLGIENMKVDEGIKVVLNNLKANLQNSIKFDNDLNFTKCKIDTFLDSISSLSMFPVVPKVVSKRVQSICVHPSTEKRIVIAGSANGSIGFWDMEREEVQGIVEFHPHTAPTNCISVNKYDLCKIYTTSHDGTVLCADIDKRLFTNIFATDYNDKVKHLTWHEEVDAHTLLVGHGNGNVITVDTREPMAKAKPMPCFVRSVRTVQLHPANDNYFLASSGLGACKIVDRRTRSRKGPVDICTIEHPKGLTSAFFSAQGSNILTTCNDDKLRIYNVHGLSETEPSLKEFPHNCHTGQWLSCFKAIWYPGREDVFLVGSLLSPRRINLYTVNHERIIQLRDTDMTTVSPVLAVHPRLALIVGGNSSGKVHAFTSPQD